MKTDNELTIDRLIQETEERIHSGQTVLQQCKEQMKVLKGKLKALHKMKLRFNLNSET